MELFCPNCMNMMGFLITYEEEEDFFEVEISCNVCDAEVGYSGWVERDLTEEEWKEVDGEQEEEGEEESEEDPSDEQNALIKAMEM